MADPAKIPPGYVYATPYTLEPGRPLEFEVTAMKADINGHAWIDPFGIMANRSQSSAHKQKVILEKLEDGTFKADLSAAHGYVWTREAKPEPKHGLSWIPVTEFTGQKPPEPVQDQPRGRSVPVRK
jgi:hypothetical protein